MILVNDLKELRLYRRKFFLPLNKKDNKKNSMVYLLTPDLQSSINVINSDLIRNKFYFSYYLESNISIFIKTDEESIEESVNVLREGYIEKEDGYVINLSETKVREELENNNIPFVLENVDGGYNIHITGESNVSCLTESANDSVIRRILFKERMRKRQELLPIYEKITSNCSQIRYTFLYLERYKERNLFNDFYFYTQSFIKNNPFKRFKALELFEDLLDRYLSDDRFNLYQNKLVIIPVADWLRSMKMDFNTAVRMESEVNIFQLIYRYAKFDFEKLQKFCNGRDVIFLGDSAYMKINFSKLDKTNVMKFLRLLKSVAENQIEDADVDNEPIIDKDSITAKIITDIETNKKIEIDNMEPVSDKIQVTTDREKIVKRIDTAVQTSETEEEVIMKLNNDEEFNNLVNSLAQGSKSQIGPEINKARQKRLSDLSEEVLNKKISETETIQQILEASEKKRNEPLPITNLSHIDTIGEGWSHLQYTNFEANYDIRADILKAFMSVSSNSYPVVIRDINVINTTTSEDLVDTYNVKFEDANGKRFEINLDIPKFLDDKFMLLKGNKKTLSAQMVLLPVSKVAPEEVQVVTNYNKIFLRKYGTKATSVGTRIINTFSKNASEITDIKAALRDCSKINLHYVVCFDYLNMSKFISVIDTKNYIFYMNQKEIRDKYKDILTNIDMTDRYPVGYDKKNKTIIFHDYKKPFSFLLLEYLQADSATFTNFFKKTKNGRVNMYSYAKVLGSRVPLVVMLSYLEGLNTTLEKAEIRYKFVEKLESQDLNWDVIKFKDAYLVFELDSFSSLLMNGLKETDFSDISITELNDKLTWLNVLDGYGSRVKLSDGLENFYDLFLDNITLEVLEDLELPTDFSRLLLYAHSLLADTKYNSDTKMVTRRYRSNELVAAHMYKAFATAYEDYKLQCKNNRKDAVISIKQTAVIDRILTEPTCSDASDINPLLDAEMANTFSWKGLSGNNSDRSYTVEKRSYDESMQNVVAMSTGFAGTVGITRQMTIDANVTGIRGYIVEDQDKSHMDATKSLSITEALSPMSSTRNDPMRVAMDFIQTAKHQLLVTCEEPSLITTGADQALPYLISNTFAFKAKGAGTVTKITKSYMIVTYEDGTHDMVDLRPTIRKNSSGGFYITVTLHTDLVVGDKFDANTILAYDERAFSKDAGFTDNIGFCPGTLGKTAILMTDEGYEDSCIVSSHFSNALSAKMIMKKDLDLSKDTEILYIAKKGQKIEKGDNLLIFQKPYDQDDVNDLLKILNKSEEEISDTGRQPITSKVTGYVEDIKIYRTVELDELSDSARDMFISKEREIKAIKKEMKANGIEFLETLEPDYALPATGKLKGCRDGFRIEFHLRYDDKYGVGDKLVFNNALKGVCRGTFPLGEEPTSEFRPDEKLMSLLAVASVNARMVCSVLSSGPENKLLIELTRKCKDILGIEWKYIDELQKEVIAKNK